MKNFYDREASCQMAFQELGPCYHLWTPENFGLIITCQDEFKTVMNIIGICSKLCPDVTILTFAVMNNHFHFTICGAENSIQDFFNLVRKCLIKFSDSLGRILPWNTFQEKHRIISDLREARNVIVYNNRNGFLANSGYTPFSYPWGAGLYYFNPSAVKLANDEATAMPIRTMRQSVHSHSVDNIKDLSMFEGYASPLSFCHIGKGEKLFRDASNYFYLLGKSIEGQKEIAKEIGESIFYNDNELYSVISNMAQKDYGTSNPALIPADGKIKFSKVMRYEYNASTKQICRMLKLDPKLVDSFC